MLISKNMRKSSRIWICPYFSALSFCWFFIYFSKTKASNFSWDEKFVLACHRFIWNCTRYLIERIAKLTIQIDLNQYTIVRKDCTDIGKENYIDFRVLQALLLRKYFFSFSLNQLLFKMFNINTEVLLIFTM